MKKVVFVTQNSPSRFYANILSTMEMCDAFLKQGFKTTLCVPKFKIKKKDLLDYYGIKHPFEIIEVNLPEVFLRRMVPGRGALYAVFVSNILSKMKDYVVYSRSPWVFFILSVLYNRCCFFEAHQIRYASRLQTIIYLALIKFGSNKGKGHIVCISKSLMKQFIQVGIDCRNISVAHDAVKLEKYQDAITKSAARKKLGINCRKPTVVYTGSLFPGKGVDMLIKCANKLKNIYFIIVGGSPQEVRELKRVVRFGNVVFTGHIQPEMVSIYQAAADILALPNTKGSIIDDVTSPLKLFEYLASEKPIVATDIPSILEILKHNYNALISPEGDDSKMAENIQILIDDPNLAKSLVQNTKKDIEKFTWGARVQYISKLFEVYY